MKSKVNIMNVDIHSISRFDLLKYMKRGVLVTPNIDHLVRLQKDKIFYNAYQAADWVVCDSKILYLAAKFLGSPIKETIPGSSLFPAYCDFHKNNDEVRIFLLGAAPGVAIKAMNRINKRIKREIVVGAHSPSFTFDSCGLECEQIINLVNQTNATVLVVGVGAPKQEKWIFDYKDRFEKIELFMALGATIDFEAGNIKRAPKLYQKIGMEWFYRLKKEPRRLWKRYLVHDMPFFYYLIKQKRGKYINPFK